MEPAVIAAVWANAFAVKRLWFLIKPEYMGIATADKMATMTETTRISTKVTPEDVRLPFGSRAPCLPLVK